MIKPMKIQNPPAPAQAPAKKRRLRGRKFCAPIYIYLNPDAQSVPGQVAKSAIMDKRDNVIADYDANGALIGIEILQPIRLIGTRYKKEGEQ